jgi:hypothetical protein
MAVEVEQRGYEALVEFILFLCRKEAISELLERTSTGYRYARPWQVDTRLWKKDKPFGRMQNFGLIMNFPQG